MVPNLCHLTPAGETHMHDLNRAGGIGAVMAELNKIGLIDTSLITANGKTVGENIKGKFIKDNNSIRSVENPYSQTGGIAILWGNIVHFWDLQVAYHLHVLVDRHLLCRSC